MTRSALILCGLATLAILLAPAVAADAPRLERIDLDGVPSVDVKLPQKAFKAAFFEDFRGKPGWAVRLVALPRNGQVVNQMLHVPTPAVVGGRVIVGGGLGSSQMFAFDARTGKHLWTSTLGDNGPSTVAATDEMVYVNTQSCTTYGIETKTGRKRWSRLLGPSVMAAPSMAGKRLLAAFRGKSGRFGLTALNPESGDHVWKRSLSGDLLGAPVCAEDRIYVTTQDGGISCFDEAGRSIWTRRKLDARSSPWIGLGGLYLATRTAADGPPRVMRLDPRNGTTIWRSGAVNTPRTRELVTVARSSKPVPVPVPNFWCPDAPRPVVLGSRCAIASGQDLLILDAGTGRQKARVQLPRDQRFHAPPAVLGENLLYATQQGLLVELTASGAVRRALDLGAPITSQPVVARGRVHVVAGGVLYGIPWGDPGGPEWTQWGGTVDRTGIVEARVRTR